MAAKTSDKKTVEILFEEARITALPERRLPLSRNLVTVELIWPKVGTAKKSASREVRFRKGVFDFTAEQWAKRCVFREEIDGHCGIVVSVSVTAVSLALTVRLYKRYHTAKAILKEGADIATSAMVGYSDIAQAPLDALATMVGEKSVPESIAQGVIDFDDLPSDGETRQVVVPLFRPRSRTEVGSVLLAVIGA